MKQCIYCGKKVTAAQLRHAEAVRIKRGKYAHTDCIDDVGRPKGDAYKREEVN